MILHWHKETELIRMTSGEFPITLNGTSYLLTSGQCLFISSGTLHGGNPKNCVYECLVFDLESTIRDSSIGKSDIQRFLDHSISVQPHYDSESSSIIQPFHSLFDSFIQKKASLKSH